MTICSKSAVRIRDLPTNRLATGCSFDFYRVHQEINTVVALRVPECKLSHLLTRRVHLIRDDIAMVHGRTNSAILSREPNSLNTKQPCANC
jgi:hypothetical protein